MPEGGTNVWTPPVAWPADETHRYIYFAAGVAQQRLGERGTIAVRTRAQQDGGVIEAVWSDENDGELLRSVARYGPQGEPAETLDLKATGLATCAADVQQGRLSVSRTGSDGSSAIQTNFEAGRIFDWRVMWGFRLLLAPWSAGLGGPLVLGYVDLSPHPPFKDGCIVADVQTQESEELVATPTGSRSVKCWRIEASCPDGREVASIGKGGEGLIRFDMNLTDSGLLIGIAG